MVIRSLILVNYNNIKFINDKEQSGRDIWKFQGDILLQGTDSWYAFGFIDERGRVMAKLNSIHGKSGWRHSIQELVIGKIKNLIL